MEGEHKAEDIMLRLQQSPRYVIELQDGHRAWNPASTKRMIYGPATVTYLLHRDGGIDAIVADLPDDANRRLAEAQAVNEAAEDDQEWWKD